MLDRIVRTLFERGDLPHADPADYHYVFNNRANVNIVLFDRRTEERLLFLKVSDLRDFGAIFAIMQKVQTLVQDTLPIPVCAFRVDRYHVLVTKAYRLKLLAGKPRLNGGERLRLADNIMNKLTDLHAKTVQGVVKLDSTYCDRVIRPMARAFFDQWADDDLARRFDRHLEPLKDGEVISVPRIPQHGDLGAFNIALVNDSLDRVLFIDWDTYGEVELCGLDAVTFLASFANLYGNALYEPSPLGRHLAAAALRYCQGVGLDRQALTFLYPIYWLHYAALKLDIGIRAGQRLAFWEIKRFLTQKERFVLAAPDRPW